MNSLRNVEIFSGDYSCNGVIVNMGKNNQACVCTTADLILEKDQDTGALRLKGGDLRIVSFGGLPVPWTKLVKATDVHRSGSCVIIVVDCPKEILPLTIADKPILQKRLKNIAKVEEMRYLVDGFAVEKRNGKLFLPSDVPYEASGLGVVDSDYTIVAFLLPHSDIPNKKRVLWQSQTDDGPRCLAPLDLSPRIYSLVRLLPVSK
jgi:hypothetical protein